MIWYPKSKEPVNYILVTKYGNYTFYNEHDFNLVRYTLAPMIERDIHTTGRVKRIILEMDNGDTIIKEDKE